MGKLIVFLITIAIFGGWDALKNLFVASLQFLWWIIKNFGVDIIKNFIFDPYNIVGIIIAIASASVVVFSLKEKRALYAVVSIVVLLSDFVGMFIIYNFA